MLLLRYLFAVLFSFLLFAGTFPPPPENCSNQRDDDLDGLIDCFDPDCDCNDDCLDFYYSGCEPECTFVPNCENIALENFWTSQANVGNYPVVVVGDLDADGLPEVVTHWINRDSLFIINGQNGATKHAIHLPTTIDGGMAPALGDIDLDGKGEIILVGNDRHIYCFEHNGELKYATTDTVGYGAGYRWSIVNLADVNYDGSVEIIIGNQIYNALDGSLLATGGKMRSDGHHPARDAGAIPYFFPSPVVVDALPDDHCPNCTGLEIIAGNQVLSVNLDSGTIQVEVQVDTSYSDGYTSIADFDLDGDLDAIIQGKLDTQNTVYVWDVQTPVVMHEFPLFTNVGGGASRPNIADLDGDGLPEISFVSRDNFYALDNDFSILWTRPIFDPSAVTVSSVFDFCGNGAAEVIYRDQDSLYIFDGPTGNVEFQTPCKSATHVEMPVIVDVDADGQTEILISCGPNAVNGNIIAFKSANTPWSKSRPVWNQHAFINTNINDDLSIPIQQQNPNIVGDSIVMNTFLNQYSNPFFPLPDLEVTSVTHTCSDDDITVNFQICNVGDAPITDEFSISAYDGNPAIDFSNHINTFNSNELLDIGQCTSISFQTGSPASGSVFVVANDDQSLTTPFNVEDLFAVTDLEECNYTNNILGTFVQNSNTVNIIDTLICVNDSIFIENIALGANADTTFIFSNSRNCDSLVRYVVTAFPVPLSSEERTICPDDSIDIFGNLTNTPGIYQQLNTGINGCDSIAEIVLFHQSVPAISFIKTNSCEGQANGDIQATVSGGTPPYSFNWNTGAATNNLTDIGPGFYDLTVTDFLGCTSSATVELDVQMIAPPDWLITPVNCPGEENGRLFLNNITSGFSYAIFPDVFQNTPLFGDLGTGDYLLTVRDSVGCLNEFPFIIPEAEITQVEVSEDRIITLGDEIVLHSFVIGENSDSVAYEWSPGEQLSCTDCPDPVATPFFDTEYQLTITDRRGCTDTASVLITVNRDRAVYIPNAFSPNADGINDYFFIRTDQSVARIRSLRIYNRWGAVVYEQFQFPPNDTAFGWNGNFKNQPLNSGVYVYVAVIEFVDQTTQQYSGDITLFR